MWQILVGAALLFLSAFPALAAGEMGKTFLQRAMQYENGRGVARDQARAYRLYCLAAINKNEDAYYHLGWMYMNGRGVTSNRQIAANWFAKGAEAGDRTSTNILKRLDGVKRIADPGCPDLKPGAHPARPAIEKLVHLLAPEYQLEPALVLAVIKAESNFNTRARSHKGAIGLMQLLPSTAKRFGVHRIKDPLQNLQGGMAYLQWLTQHFDGDLPLILAGYNAGERAVERHRGIPPYRETQHYVKKITRDYRKVSLSSPQVSESRTLRKL